MKLFTSPTFTLLSSIAYLFIVGPIQSLLRNTPKRNAASRLGRILERIQKEPAACSIAHRGGIPENTVRAFHKSKLGGARAVEVDLQFTKDGHPVLFHDWTVDRVSDRSGHLHDMTLYDIQSLDVGYKYGHEGVTVPTLYEAIDALKELDMYMFLELKDPRKQSTSTVITLFQDDPSLYDRIIVISFFPHLLYQLRKQDPRIIIGLNLSLTDILGSTVRHSTANSCRKLIFTHIVDKCIGRCLINYMWKILATDLVLPDKEDILEKRLNLEYFQSKDVNIVTWTVNCNKEKEYFKNVLQIPVMSDHVTTDISNHDN